MSTSEQPVAAPAPLILCGIGAGIAAYKAAEVVSLLRGRGLRVRVCMTPGAQAFVQPLTFQALTGEPVAVNMFCAPTADAREAIYPHLYPAADAAAYLVLPATADLLAKLAHGLADDLVCASALGLPPTVLKVFCPAMNHTMWTQPIVQENAARLRAAGWLQVGPADGRMACGTSGPGRLTEPDEIVRTVMAGLDAGRPLSGRRVLILSGPTREWLDPVRYLSNASSGRLGQALALTAARRGAQVEFVTGPVDPARWPVHPAVRAHPVETAEQMLTAATPLFPASDVIIFAAAVADYAPRTTAPCKQSKSPTGLTLELRPNPDLPATLCAGKQPHQVAVGFALQDTDPLPQAREKLARKGLDAIVLNSPAALNAPAADYTYLTARDSAAETWGLLEKTDFAARLLDRCAALLPPLS
ncbi:MAG: bifunctional phosphopantothenoylcysteine decarboxylase/phosphopantothenate--cysteine ligase CoaBC [Candidatus Marinimicrobia bacterium]|nr:bifunctional phosphopantothenoylcysteine decarboxylase/phosphopantothenate--cysteine ligase CoaBC [Candidatus Neomarinimicrobiota bacterium]